MKKLFISLLGLGMAAMMPIAAAEDKADASKEVVYEVEMTGVV